MCKLVVDQMMWKQCFKFLNTANLELFLGAWNYESQAQHLAVWPRTVAHSCVCNWAIMGGV